MSNGFGPGNKFAIIYSILMEIDGSLDSIIPYTIKYFIYIVPTRFFDTLNYIYLFFKALSSSHIFGEIPLQTALMFYSDDSDADFEV